MVVMEEDSSNKAILDMGVKATKTLDNLHKFILAMGRQQNSHPMEATVLAMDKVIQDWHSHCKARAALAMITNNPMEIMGSRVQIHEEGMEEDLTPNQVGNSNKTLMTSMVMVRSRE